MFFDVFVGGGNHHIILLFHLDLPCKGLFLDFPFQVQLLTIILHFFCHKEIVFPQSWFIAASLYFFPLFSLFRIFSLSTPAILL